MKKITEAGEAGSETRQEFRQSKLRSVILHVVVVAGIAYLLW
ncbi:MAG: hypothetical protein AAGG48_07105 [Planctomycetota bacterium]